MREVVTHFATAVARAFIFALCFASANACKVPPETRSQVQIAEMDIPARYQSALPANLQEMEAWQKGSQRFAPTSHVVETLMLGNAEMFQRMETASRAVPAEQKDAWAQSWQSMLEFETASEALCELSRPVMEAPASTMRMAIASTFVEHCFQPGDQALILRSDTPNRAIITLYDEYDGPARRGIAVAFDERLEAAAEEVILTGAAYEARGAAFAMIGSNIEEAEKALVRIYSELPDDERKKDVAAALTLGKSEDAKRVARELCKNPDADPICSYDDPAEIFEPEDDSPAPTIEAIQANKDRLASLGFVRVASIDEQSIGTDAIEVLLMDAGYGHWFDVETGLFPNGHDTLLRSLASLTSPSLDRAIFEEVAPRDDVGPYELRAYLDGKRFSIKAENLGDWYDVVAVLDLIDFMLAEQKSDFALLPLPTEDQTLIVIGAPKPAIEKALEAGLIRRGEFGQAEEIGKDFENQVLGDLNEN